MIKQLFISAGHSNKIGRDRGAAGSGYIEGELTVEFRDLLVGELRNLGVAAKVDGNDTVSGETVRAIKTIIQNKVLGVNPILVDIHFNAATPQATGTEVLVPAVPSVFEKGLSTELAVEMAAVLQIKNRGVKTELQSARKKLVWMEPKGENILLEICFISNPDDMKRYQAKKLELARELAVILKKWMEK